MADVNQQLDPATKERLDAIAGALDKTSLDDLTVQVATFNDWIAGRLGKFFAQLSNLSDPTVAPHARSLVLGLAIARDLMRRIARATKHGETRIEMPAQDDVNVLALCGRTRAKLLSVSLLLDETAADLEKTNFASCCYYDAEAFGVERAAALAKVAQEVTVGAAQATAKAKAAGTS